MEDIAVGLVALLAGTVFCFSGYRAFRLVIPIWGAFVGFSLGAGVVAALTGDALLAKPVGWLVGFFVALVFAGLAYLYYEVAITLSMGSLGFAAGASLMVALGVSWNWLVALVGILIGIAAAVLAIVTNLPRIVLVVVSATAGAKAIVGGAMLLVGALETADFTNKAITARIEDDWWWYPIYLFLALAGIVSQARSNAEADARAYWVATGGHPAAGAEIDGRA